MFVLEQKNLASDKDVDPNSEMEQMASSYNKPSQETMIHIKSFAMNLMLRWIIHGQMMTILHYKVQMIRMITFHLS